MKNKLKDKLIDLSGLSDDEKLEKMEEILKESGGGEAIILDHYQQYPDEHSKKKTPAYVAQFGLNHIKKRGK